MIADLCLLAAELYLAIGVTIFLYGLKKEILQLSLVYREHPGYIILIAGLFALFWLPFIIDHQLNHYDPGMD